MTRRLDAERVDGHLRAATGERFHRTRDIVGVGPAQADTTRLLFENKSVVGFHLGRAMRRDPQSVLKAIPELTELLADGDLEVVVGERFPLSAAADAHDYIENRRSTGKVVLEP
ncbi:zinc-binding dehydrogenase [Haloprofundus halobius]|uniref:zinc-binding dehydrogenase n=1 Tax=Haloprofundus halobius TaxID=2876194 RepID=UPI003CCD81BC